MSTRSKRSDSHAGYDGLKVRDLAGRCGMASGTFYGCFPNKDDLVFQLMDLGWKGLFAKIDAAMRAGLPAVISPAWRGWIRPLKRSFLRKRKTGTAGLRPGKEKRRTS
jgi:AcrR family transcriptional regulator